MATQAPKKPPSPKVKINWMEDSSRKQSCHLNDGGLMAVDSYVGHIQAMAIGDQVRWVVTLRGAEKVIEFRSWAQAKKYVEDSVNGEPVSEWD